MSCLFYFVNLLKSVVFYIIIYYTTRSTVNEPEGEGGREGGKSTATQYCPGPVQGGHGTDLERKG